MRRELTLENLKLHKNGRRIHAAWHHDLQRLVADCQDRPADDRTRELHLILRMSPVLDEDGIDCEDVHLDFEVKAKVPSRQIRGDKFGVTKGNNVFFMEESPDNPDQQGLFDDEIRRSETIDPEEQDD